ncbi:MAG TPA: L,D-transpeptidase [Brevundimonas sp.]|nr:L,D-transpeptidase [Brevundimonas sp.]
MAAPLTRVPIGALRRLALAALGLLCLGVVGAPPAYAGEGSFAAGSPPPTAGSADFLEESASADARETASWIIRTGDNQGLPFIIVDKKNTKVFVFDGGANLRGATIALLGLAVGDDSAPGVGDRALSQIRPEERTTPTGRFVASFGVNLAGQDVLWVDYDTALALHRVLDAGTRQHRLERLAPRSGLSRRITFGCINVPVTFYEEVVQAEFRGTVGVVYILPETRPIHEVFPGQLTRP